MHMHTNATCSLTKATVREAARDYKKVTAVTKEMAQREAELESEGYQVRHTLFNRDGAWV